VFNLYDVNALVHWDEREILAREAMTGFFAAEVAAMLRRLNPAFDIRRVEAPVLIPRALISPAYANSEVWAQERLGAHDHDLVLRPETTPSTYAYMRRLLDSHQRVKLPLCVWQAGKSFRREQDQPAKHMRLKEFHQMEFQCAYAADTANDYHTACLEPVRRMIAAAVAMPTRLVASDRLPDYAEVTTDVEMWNQDKWMEVCSISRRTDFPGKASFAAKGGGVVERDVRVLEIAIGLDRLVYNWGLALERV
jgi:glycyl-tRNA synthetase